MLQTVDGREVYIVDIGTPLPNLPITWNTEEERPYAEALTQAIQLKQIQSPGKYGIEITHEANMTIYNLFHVVE